MNYPEVPYADGPPSFEREYEEKRECETEMGAFVVPGNLYEEIIKYLVRDKDADEHPEKSVRPMDPRKRYKILSDLDKCTTTGIECNWVGEVEVRVDHGYELWECPSCESIHETEIEE